MPATVETEVAQLCLTLCDPVDCSLPGSSIRGIFQARLLDWVAISFSNKEEEELTPSTSHPRQLMSNSFYRWRAGATGRNSAVSSDNHLETGHHWSDQCYLDCCQYSESSGPGYICFHFLGQFSELCELLSWFPRRLSGKESACQIRRRDFAPSVGKIPERREWQLTAVFLPGESHGRRNLVGYSPWGHKEPLHFLSLCNSMHCSTPGFPVFHCLPGVC